VRRKLRNKKNASGGGVFESKTFWGGAAPKIWRLTL